MLHGTKRFRHGSAALTALIVLIASILLVDTASAAPASAATPVATPAERDTGTVRLVRTPDGALEVHTGPRTRTVGDVVAEGPDVAFRPAGDPLPLVDGLVDDLMRRNQWSLDLLQAETVWATADGEGQVIAVVAPGVDADHPDLAARMVEGLAVRGTDPTVDGLGHGTHVAGIAAAVAGDAFGTAGLAHRAQIMPVKVIDDDGLGYASDVAEGVLWAVDNGATVINLSLAGTQRSTVLDAAISHAVAQGVVVVAAAGNEYRDGNPRVFPAAHDEVIAVASISDPDSRSSFSSVGDWVDIAAPGSSILSARPGGVHGFASGTSMATPLVAAAAALVRQVAPELTPAEVGALLTDTAIDVGPRGRDDEFGHGTMDVLAALAEIAPQPEAEQPEAEQPEESADGEASFGADGDDAGADEDQVQRWDGPLRTEGRPAGRLPVVAGR